MRANDAQYYTRVAGILIVVSLLAGGFGESYAPEKLLLSGDFAGTAQTIAAHVGLFRAGFLAYVLEAACDLSLTAIYYLLLRPVSRPVALIVVCFDIFSTAIFAVGEIFYFVAGLPSTDAHFANALTPEDRVRIGYLCLKLYGCIFTIFSGFYGCESLLRGYLIFRSGYFPRTLGALVMLGGAGFIIKNFFAIIAPQYDSMVLVLPTLLAMLALAFWFLVKGINRAQWEQHQQLASSQQ